MVLSRWFWPAAAGLRRPAGVASEADDFVVLGGEAGGCMVAEAGEVADRAGRSGEAFFQRSDLVLEPDDLGVSRVGLLACLVECAEPFLEFGAEVGVGAAAVEGGAVDALLTELGLEFQQFSG